MFNIDEHMRIPGSQLTRRELGKLAIGGAIGGAFLGSADGAVPVATLARNAVVRPQPPGLKLGVGMGPNPTDDDLLFLKQMGVGYVFCGITPEFASVEGLLHVKKRYADAGIAVHNVRNMSVTNELTDIALNRPGRDRKIEDFNNWLRIAGKAGFHYTVASFHAVDVLQTGLADERGSKVRDFDLASPTQGLFGPISTAQAAADNLPARMGPPDSLLFGREYTPDELWANYTYFIKQVTPVAEEEQIAIGFHPDDPPVPVMYGVPRLFSSFASCKRALEIANSPNVGLCLCCGTWAEGGDAMGTDPAGAVRYFGAQKKIFEIHYRNVSSPLPHFHETALDDGYYDMYKIMKALVDVKYDGIVHQDHAVPMVGGSRTYTAFAMGYMKALLQRAQAADKV